MELKEGARVVYPSQGICEVEGLETLEIAGTSASFVRLRRIYDEATVRVPVARATEVGIRQIASVEEAEAALFHLRDSVEEPDMNWKTRQRRHQQVLAEGSLLGLAEMLRELFGVSLVRPLPARERDGYDQVRRLLMEELGHVLALPSVAVEDQLDLALLPPGGPEDAGEPFGEIRDFDDLERLLAAVAGTPKKKAGTKKAAGSKKAPAAKKPAKKVASKKTTRKPAAKKPAKKASGRKTAGAAKKTTKKAAAKKSAKKTAKKKAGKAGGKR